MLEIDEAIGRMLLEPPVIVVPNGFVEIPLVLADRGRAQALGGVERTTLEILVELGRRLTSGGRIQIFVLKRHGAGSCGLW